MDDPVEPATDEEVAYVKWVMEHLGDNWPFPAKLVPKMIARIELQDAQLRTWEDVMERNIEKERS